jgi:metal-responsive CopG/Arc/MetJ family transcriptional regulator
VSSPMASNGYASCAIPDGLAERVERLIQNPLLGYRSRGEFIVEAVRRMLDEYEPRFGHDAPRADPIARRRRT